MQWQFSPISTVVRALIEERRDPEHFPDRAAVEKFRAREGSGWVDSLVRSKSFLRFAARGRQALPMSAGAGADLRSLAVGTGGALPADGESEGQPGRRFQVTAVGEDGSLKVSLVEDEHGRLIAHAETGPEKRGVSRVQVEVLSGGAPLEARVLLDSPGANGSMHGTHDFGPFEKFASRLAGCVLVASDDAADLRQALRDGTVAAAPESIRESLARWIDEQKDFLERAIRVLDNRPFGLAFAPAVASARQGMLAGPPKSVFKVGGVDGYQFVAAAGRPSVRFPAVPRQHHPPLVFLSPAEPGNTRRLTPVWDESLNCWVIWLDGAPDEYCLVMTPNFGG